jgi:hypothetical protein
MSRTQDPTTRTAGSSAANSPAAVTIEDLIAVQGVSPVTNLDALGALFPTDQDPDQLLFFLGAERAARRAAAAEKEAR